MTYTPTEKQWPHEPVNDNPWVPVEGKPVEVTRGLYGWFAGDFLEDIARTVGAVAPGDKLAVRIVAVKRHKVHERKQVEQRHSKSKQERPREGAVLFEVGTEAEGEGEE